MSPSYAPRDVISSGHGHGPGGTFTSVVAQHGPATTGARPVSRERTGALWNVSGGATRRCADSRDVEFNRLRYDN